MFTRSGEMETHRDVQHSPALLGFGSSVGNLRNASLGAQYFKARKVELKGKIRMKSYFQLCA